MATSSTSPTARPHAHGRLAPNRCRSQKSISWSYRLPCLSQYPPMLRSSLSPIVMTPVATAAPTPWAQDEQRSAEEGGGARGQRGLLERRGNGQVAESCQRPADRER